MLLVCRFSPADPEVFVVRARRAVALLGAQPGCEAVELGRAVEEPGRWVLTATFATLTAYRRALAPFDVREHVVPLLSEALSDEPSTFERTLSAAPGGVVEHASVLTDRDGPARS